jgi:hypothetical protein
MFFLGPIEGLMGAAAVCIMVSDRFLLTLIADLAKSDFS